MAEVRLQLYAFFHLNLAYSSIEEEQRPEVVERCYWPLLRLAREYNLPFGIEISGQTLETIAKNGPIIGAHGQTDLFIQPGYQFKVVNTLITNFHLPKSTLLALVGAFAGMENVLKAYRHAIEHQYRFFSYGDAMLIV